MAIRLIKDDTEFEGMGSDGKRTATRHMVFSYDQGDTQMDLANSPLLPELNDVHPDYAGWRAESIGKPEYFDNPRRYIIDATYAYNSNITSSLSDYKKDAKPWDEPYSNIQISTYDKEISVQQWFDGETDEPKPIENGAGDAIPMTDTVSMIRISFSKNYKSKKNKLKFDIPASYSYNSSDIKIFGIEIKAYCGKLLPFTIDKHIVVDGSGKEKYVYDTVNYTIEVAPYNEDLKLYGWKKVFLNVGTRAKFENKDGVKHISRIYKYRYLPSYNKATYFTDLANAKELYGSLEDLIAARKAFLDSSKEATSSMFPYEEITEPMPLNEDGTLDLDALISKRYKTVSGYMKKGESWTRYNLPINP